MNVWPDCKIVHGSPRHPQTQGSVERSNQDVKNMLRAWMRDNNSKNWSVGCNFVQYQKNASFHRIIGRAPYRALFGCDPKSGLRSSNIPRNILPTIQTEEDLELISHNVTNDIGVVTTDSQIEDTMSLIPSNDSVVVGAENQIQDSVSLDFSSNNTMIVELSTSTNNVGNNTWMSGIDTDLEKNTINSNDRPNDASGHQIPILKINDCDIITKVVETTQDTIKNNQNAYNTDDKTIPYDCNCLVCGKSTSGAHQCYSCLKSVHAICGFSDGTEGYGSKILCLLCSNELKIRNERKKSHHGVKRAADKMTNDTAKKLPSLCVGDSIFVNVPKIDRGPLDTKNIFGKIVDIRNGLYRVGTKSGIIKNWLSRHELQISLNEHIAEVPCAVLSLREAVTKQSLFGGQGFQKCSCKPAKNQCHTNRCACFKKKKLCGSKCHSSMTCINKI